MSTMQLKKQKEKRKGKESSIENICENNLADR